ncbi:MAG TPA: hypothetical protein VGG61_05875 [Gemmataceae bacterium]|jgi:hypothetical protein
MTGTLTAHLGDLAEALHDLRRRFRMAARVEVARAIGEALCEVTRAMICGPNRLQSSPRSAYSDWDDPWQDPAADPGHFYDEFSREDKTDDEDRKLSTMLPPMLLAGLGAARWGFMLTRRMGASLLIGLLIALATYVGGPAIKTLLEAWSAASDLLNFPRPSPLS